MNENNPNGEHLLLREVLNENLIRDTILFSTVFLFIISQEWNNVLLLFFPLVSFIFSIFFKIIATNRYHIQQGSHLSYYPMGSEKRNSNRLFFASIFLSLLTLWMGYESYLTPQLIDNFFFSFSILFILIYTFSFLWIFIDIWKYAIIKIKLDDKEINFSFLNRKCLFRILLTEFIIFIILNLLNLSLTLFINLEFLSIFPGLKKEEFILTYIYMLYFIILVISPFLASINLNKIYKQLQNYERENFKVKLEEIPEEIQERVISELDQKFKKTLFKDE